MSRHSVSLPMVGAWLALFACACTKSTEAPDLGTNTNWLKTCSEQRECGARGSCVCGVCTSTCSADAQCAAVHGETRCQAVSATACGGSSQSPSAACLQGCGADEDCSALESGRCLDGLCVPVPKLGAEPEGEPLAGGPSTQPTLAGPKLEPTAGGASMDPAPGERSADPTYTLARVSGNVAITDAYTECERDSECLLVGTSCNGCCELGAINSALAPIYRPEQERACADYRGGICDCSFQDLVARCEAGRCRAVGRDTAACFSPTQSPERAFDEGAVGCRCLRRDDAICSGGAALRCAQDGNEIPLLGDSTFFFTWRLSESGRCAPKADSECSGDRRFSSAESCFAAFSSCYELVGGAFCGLLSL